MPRYFPAAPWPTSLKVISLLATVVLTGLGYAAYRVIPTPSGFTHDFGLAVALIPFGVLVGCIIFIVDGYTVEPTRLSVQRLLTVTTVPLTGLRRAWIEPAVCKGSVRVFGNGGLYSFSGWFYSKRLGRYRLFATDLRNTIVLQFRDRAIVISPAAPVAFVEHLRHVIPDLQIGPVAGNA